MEWPPNALGLPDESRVIKGSVVGWQYVCVVGRTWKRTRDFALPDCLNKLNHKACGWVNTGLSRR